MRRNQGRLCSCWRMRKTLSPLDKICLSLSPVRWARVCVRSICFPSSLFTSRINQAPAPAPPKEEQAVGTEKPKDATEPADQQVDKKLPEPPAPSEKPKEVKKEATKGKDLEKAPKKEEKPLSAAVPGSRNETRVCPRQDAQRRASNAFFRSK